MIDFSNLTDEQKEFFNNMWENHQRDNEQNVDGIKEFETYIAKRRKQEDDQARAAETLKTKMV
jgi:hypothetical protein